MTRPTTNPTQSTAGRAIGAHVSAAGGPEKTMKRAADIGANAVQLFSGSPRSWARKDLADINTEKVLSEKEKYNIGPMIVHSMYLVNLTSEKPEQRKKSQAVVEYDLRFISQLGGGAVVVHLGSHGGRGWEAVRDDLAARLQDILESTPEDATLLIENSAGQNGKLSSDLTEVRWLLDKVGSPRLQWCLDTCHAFAAGYHFGAEQPEEHGKERIKAQALQDELDRLELWDALYCLHVNDSKDPFASGRDRHENLLDGTIGKLAFRKVLHDERLDNVPLIIEVPGVKGNGPDAENIARLKQLLAE